MAESITQEEFEAKVINGKGVVVVDFWAPWCGPCQMMGQVLEKIEDDRFAIVKVNVDEAPELAEQFGIMGIPALKVFKDGELVAEEAGLKTEDEIVKLAEGVL